MLSHRWCVSPRQSRTKWEVWKIVVSNVSMFGTAPLFCNSSVLFLKAVSDFTALFLVYRIKHGVSVCIVVVADVSYHGLSGTCRSTSCQKIDSGSGSLIINCSSLEFFLGASAGWADCAIHLLSQHMPSACHTLFFCNCSRSNATLSQLRAPKFGVFQIDLNQSISLPCVFFEFCRNNRNKQNPIYD